MNHTLSHSSRKASEGRAEQDSATLERSLPRPQQPDQNQPIDELIKLGVDTHGGQYVFARMIDHQGSQPAQKLSPQQFIGFVQKQLKLARRVVMVYEAGPYGFSLYRQVSAMGAECLVCAPERLSRGRKRVNDKIDAKELLSRLDRYLAGNRTALRLVHVPSLEQELRRRTARERNTYRKKRQRWISRGRSLLHSLGIARPGRWWEMDRYPQLLKQVQGLLEAIPDQHHGPQMPPAQVLLEPIQAELEREVEMIHLMQTKLEELTALLVHSAGSKPRSKKKSRNKPDQEAQPHTPPAPAHPLRIKGIGGLSQQLLEREIIDWNRFGNRRQVASYTGLCPGESSSGDSQMSLSIDKHGNPHLRGLLVELAWLLPRYQPQYRRLARWKWVFENGSKAGKAIRKKAAVALARHLAVDLWRIHTGRARPEDLGLQLIAA